MQTYEFVHCCITSPLYRVEAETLVEAFQKYQQELDGISGPRSEEVQSDQLESVYCGDQPIKPSQWPQPYQLLSEPTVPDYPQFARDLVQLLYGDVETGKLTGENTLSSRSGADFIDAVEDLVRCHQIPFTLVEPHDADAA